MVYGNMSMFAASKSYFSNIKMKEKYFFIVISDDGYMYVHIDMHICSIERQMDKALSRGYFKSICICMKA